MFDPSFLVHLSMAAHRKATFILPICVKFLPVGQAEIALTEKRKANNNVGNKVPKLLEDRQFKASLEHSNFTGIT